MTFTRTSPDHRPIPPATASRPRMRTRRIALALALATAMGAAAAPAGAAPKAKSPRATDTSPPQTTLTAGPPAATTSTSASFSFTASEAGSFECALDAAPFGGCTSPRSYSALAVGGHTFRVRARDNAGNVDATPAETTWQVAAADGICAIDPADGQAAIAAAIQRCPNGSKVSFPANRAYHQTDAISIERRSGLTIDGNGSTFIKTNAGEDSVARPQWRILEGSNITIEDMTIDGSLPSGPRGIPPGNQWDHGVYISGGTGHTVRDVTIRNVFGDAVTVAPSGLHLYGDATGGQIARDVLIQRVTATSTARMCLGLTGGIGIRAEDNVLSDCRYAGIDLETDAVGEKLQNVQILRNQISGYYLFAIGVAGPAYAPPNPGDIDNIEIRGNTTLTASDTCWEAIHAERGPFSNLVVADNPMLKSLGDGIELYDVTSGSVSGNTIQLTASPLLCNSPSIPVRLVASPNVTVAANTSTGY